MQVLATLSLRLQSHVVPQHTRKEMLSIDRADCFPNAIRDCAEQQVCTCGRNLNDLRDAVRASEAR